MYVWATFMTVLLLAAVNYHSLHRPPHTPQALRRGAGRGASRPIAPRPTARRLAAPRPTTKNSTIHCIPGTDHDLDHLDTFWPIWNLCIRSRSYRSYPAKHVQIMQIIHISSMKHVQILQIIQIPPTQTCTRMCVKDLDHTDPTYAKICKLSRSYRSHPAKCVCKI